VPLDEEILVSHSPRVDLLALDDALKASRSTSAKPRRGAAILWDSTSKECRGASGLPETVHRDWRWQRMAAA